VSPIIASQRLFLSPWHPWAPASLCRPDSVEFQQSGEVRASPWQPGAVLGACCLLRPLICYSYYGWAQIRVWWQGGMGEVSGKDGVYGSPTRWAFVRTEKGWSLCPSRRLLLFRAKLPGGWLWSGYRCSGLSWLDCFQALACMFSQLNLTTIIGTNRTSVMMTSKSLVTIVYHELLLSKWLTPDI
jgi:hypothetical protein